MKVAILGVGSYGTALAYLLGNKGYDVYMWSHDPIVEEVINKNRKNPNYLADIELPESITVSCSAETVLKKADFVFNVIPTHHIRKTLIEMIPFFEEESIIVNGSKGIENESLLTVSEMFEEIFPKRYHMQFAYISGPSFAYEIAQDKITAVAVASHSVDNAKRVKELMTTHYYKVFTTKDVMGLELCGSLKNIIAIISGIVDGLKLGKNCLAAVITGGIAEITRIGIKKGANLSTFLGLAGIGDLVLTCTGDLSRNRQVGLKLATGKTIEDILEEMTMIAEGVKTTKSAYDMAKQLDVKVPIIEELYYVLYENKPVKDMIEDILSRDLQSELGSTPLSAI